MILEGDFPIEPGEEEAEKKDEQTVVETIAHYGKRMTDSLKNAVACTIATGKHTNDSLVDLQSQNESLNRIKNALNEAHSTVTITQRIVDSYVNSMRWIRSSIPWKKAVTLSKEEIGAEPVANAEEGTAPSYWQRLFKLKGESEAFTAPAKNEPVEAALGDFSRTATQHLDTLINELKLNRKKTQLISTAVQKQNDELEKIGDSAIALQQRVAQVNRVLKDNG